MPNVPQEFAPASGFLTPLKLEYLDGRQWRVVAAFDYASLYLERLIRVPVGFITDFASVPRVLWSCLPPTGGYGPAALVHDVCYRTPGLCSRADADRVLLEGMELLGVSRFVRWIIYSGVRVAGRAAWKGTSNA